jgi:lipopolysaccharide biosynthesis glycosyltransferase
VRAIHVACTFDKAMAVPALLVAWSIKQTMKSGRPIVFHAVACEDDAILGDAARLLNSEFFEFSPTRAPSSDLFNVDLSRAIVTSPATLVRVDLPDIIPEADRILYLDCDLFVRRPLDALFDFDLDGHIIAACSDYLMMELTGVEGPRSKFARHVATLVSDPRAYFNAGVLLIDCAKWRAGGYSARLKSLLLSSPQFLFADQDALNSVFQTGYRRLDPRWNAFAFHPKPIRDKEVAQLAARCEADPWITHFVGAAKPWIRHQAQTPQHKPFWKLVESSPFHDEMLTLSASVSLGAAPALRRSISRKAAELLMSTSRGLHFLEVRLRKNPDISLSLFSAAENLYQKGIN